MSQKFHINKHGVPAPCRATKGNCPYGGEDGQQNHFDNLQDAQDHINNVHEGKHGLIPGAPKSYGNDSLNSKLDSISSVDERVDVAAKEFSESVVGNQFKGIESGMTDEAIEETYDQSSFPAAGAMNLLESRIEDLKGQIDRGEELNFDNGNAERTYDFEPLEAPSTYGDHFKYEDDVEKDNEAWNKAVQPIRDTEDKYRGAIDDLVKKSGNYVDFGKLSESGDSKEGYKKFLDKALDRDKIHDKINDLI